MTSRPKVTVKVKKHTRVLSFCKHIFIENLQNKYFYSKKIINLIIVYAYYKIRYRFVLYYNR